MPSHADQPPGLRVIKPAPLVSTGRHPQPSPRLPGLPGAHEEARGSRAHVRRRLLESICLLQTVSVNESSLGTGGAPLLAVFALLPEDRRSERLC